MNMKLQIAILVSVIVLAGITFSPGFKDSFAYHYMRIKEGKTLDLEGNCYEIPKGWIIIKSFTRNDSSKTYGLLNRSDKKNNTVSISSVGEISPSFPDSFKPLLSVNKNIYLYENISVNEDDLKRYWSHISISNLVLSGNNLKGLKFISNNLNSIECGE